VGGDLIEHTPEARRMTTYGRHFVELAARLGPQDSKKAAQDFHSNRSPARTNIAVLIPDRSSLRKRVRPLAICRPSLKKDAAAHNLIRTGDAEFRLSVVVIWYRAPGGRVGGLIRY